MVFTVQQVAALVIPLELIATMIRLFRALQQRFAYPLSYLLGFMVYWVGWCLVVPALLLGRWVGLLDLFSPIPSFAALDWKTHVLLWGPLVFPLFFMFIPRIRRTNLAIVGVSIVLGIVIGITEEVLWRGVYIRLFPHYHWLNLAYPTLMFAVWHICPQTVLPNKLPGGVFSFVAYAFLLGLSYALVATMTGSIGWSVVAHSIHDALGLGGFAYALWLTPRSSHLHDELQANTCFR